MRLNKNHKYAFVRAVLNDVPKEDFNQKRMDLLQGYLTRLMPPEVRAVYDKPELRPYLDKSFYWKHTSGPFFGLSEQAMELPKELEENVKTVLEAEREQTERIAQLREKLKAAINGCATRKQAVEAMPELEKYLPAEEEATRNLPAVTSTIAALVEAGWPKEAA